MAIEKQIFLNKLDINVQNPSIEVVKRVSFYDNGEEMSRTHTSTIYQFVNEEHLFASESQFVKDAWTMVSASFVETSGNIE
jgi:hypothetical protein